MRHNRSTTSTAAAFCPSSPATPPRNTISIANEEPMMIASNICTRQQYLLPLPLRFTKQGHYTVIAGRTDRRAALSVLMFLYSLPNFLIFRPNQGENLAWSLAAKLLVESKKVRGAMMAQTSSIIVQSLVEIDRRTSV